MATQQNPKAVSGDIVHANKAHFDEQAHHHDQGHLVFEQKLARKNVSAMHDVWPALFSEDETMVMDYACGMGAVSQQLCPYVKAVVGVDISPAAVERYNSNANNQGLSPDEMRAVTADLKGEPSELDGLKFDLVVCCAAYHHFPSLEETTQILASFLKPGGSLLIADIKAAEDDHQIFSDSHLHIVAHKNGLSEEVMRNTFEGVGLTGFEMKESFTVKMPWSGEDACWFVARGVKAE